MARLPNIQRCKTHNTRLNPDTGIIDVPNSGAINQNADSDGVKAASWEFPCGCFVESRIDRTRDVFDTVELNNSGEPV